MNDKDKDRKTLFNELYQIIKVLRSPDGCPWDLKQTAFSLRSDLLDEVYECIDAIDAGDDKHLEEELGDVLLLIVMISRIKEQENAFVIEDVLSGICRKLVRRHPHVFGEKKIRNIKDIIQTWDYIKENVEGKTYDQSILENIPKSLPPLEKAFQIQKKAAKVGFQWDAVEPVFEKLEEEMEELKHEYQQQNWNRCEEELGDVLFTVVNIARMLKINPTLALNQTNRKFTKRFREIESILKDQGISLKQADIQLMDKLWDEIKKREKE